MCSLAALPFFLATAPAQAGSWNSVVTSNNTGSRSTINGFPYSVPTYSPPGSGPGSSVSFPSYQVSASGSGTGCSANATVHAQVTFTWQPDSGQTFTSDPPPPSILVLETSSASWSSGGGDSQHAATLGGSANDGLGDQEFDSNPSTTSRSGSSVSPSNYGPSLIGEHLTRYTPDASGTVTLPQRTLAASASTSYPSNSPWYSGATASTGSYSVSIHAQPCNFFEVGHYDAIGLLPGPAVDNTNGTLTYLYDWKSTTGKKADLGTCTIHEIVSYDGNTSGSYGTDPSTGKPTYSPVQPPFYQTVLFNPETGESTPATTTNSDQTKIGAIQDTNGHVGFVRDANTFTYPTAGYTATQKFVFADSATGEVATLLAGPWTITRSVQPLSPPAAQGGMYTINKTGDSATDTKDLP